MQKRIFLLVLICALLAAGPSFAALAEAADEPIDGGNAQQAAEPAQDNILDCFSGRGGRSSCISWRGDRVLCLLLSKPGPRD